MDRGLACQAEVGGCSGAAARCLRALLGWDGLERAAHSQGHRRFVAGLATCSWQARVGSCRSMPGNSAGSAQAAPRRRIFERRAVRLRCMCLLNID